MCVEGLNFFVCFGSCLVEEDSMGGERVCQKRSTKASKETYYSVKRDLLECQKDLLQRQKRSTIVSKETYYSVKRDLL